VSVRLKNPHHEPDQADNTGGDKPLLFRAWRSWYILVIAELALIILLLAWITRVFH